MLRLRLPPQPLPYSLPFSPAGAAALLPSLLIGSPSPQRPVPPPSPCQSSAAPPVRTRERQIFLGFSSAPPSHCADFLHPAPFSPEASHALLHRPQPCHAVQLLRAAWSRPALLCERLTRLPPPRGHAALSTRARCPVVPPCPVRGEDEGRKVCLNDAWSPMSLAADMDLGGSV
jgi:hypothetical protein